MLGNDFLPATECFVVHNRYVNIGNGEKKIYQQKNRYQFNSAFDTKLFFPSQLLLFKQSVY